MAKTISRGGKRDGAGRPQGSGKYGQPTQAIRVPSTLVNELKFFLKQYKEGEKAPWPAFALKANVARSLHRPLYEDKVAAGFPSPAEDQIDTQLDLNDHLVKNPATTFYVRVEGNSMIGAGIHHNDLLVVDLSLEARDGQIIIALLNGEFTVKRLKISKNKSIQLLPENEEYPTIAVEEGMDFRIWGVVTSVIHSL